MGLIALPDRWSSIMSAASERKRYLGYEIQHIFMEEILNGLTTEARDAKLLLAEIGFDIQSRGNKIALFRSRDTLDALKNTPSNIQDAFFDSAGFGKDIHDSQAPGGNHPGYSKFVIDTLSDIYELSRGVHWTPAAKERAVFDLHRFVTGLAEDGSIPLIGSSALNFKTAWLSTRNNQYGEYGEIR
jgi:hypothetical protein